MEQWCLARPSGHGDRPVSPERKKQLGGAFPQARGIFSCGAQRLVKNSFGQWERAPLQAARAPSTQQTVSAHSGSRKCPHATAALGSCQGQPHLQNQKVKIKLRVSMAAAIGLPSACEREPMDTEGR